MDFSHLQQIVFVGCTHGDEQLGRFIVQEFPFGTNETKMWKTIIANPIAMDLNIRGFEADLNRSYPGNTQSPLYEERRAVEVLDVVKKFDVVIDIHQAFAYMDDIILVKEWNEVIAKIAQSFNIEHVIELDKGLGSYSGLLLSYVKNGIAIEYGRSHLHKEACHRVKKDLDNLIEGNIVQPLQKRYRIVGDLPLDAKGKTDLENLVEISAEQRSILGLQEEYLYPIFLNGYDDKWGVLIQRLDG